MTKKLVGFNMFLVNQDGKKEPCGRIFYNPESIAAIKNIWDKHDVEILGVVGIQDRNGGIVVVEGTIEEVVEKIEEALL